MWGENGIRAGGETGMAFLENGHGMLAVILEESTSQYFVASLTCSLFFGNCLSIDRLLGNLKLLI